MFSSSNLGGGKLPYLAPRLLSRSRAVAVVDGKSPLRDTRYSISPHRTHSGEATIRIQERLWKRGTYEYLLRAIRKYYAWMWCCILLYLLVNFLQISTSRVCVTVKGKERERKEDMLKINVASTMMDHD